MLPFGSQWILMEGSEFYKVKKGELLSIKNEEGEIIYSLKIKNSGSYSRIFDVSKLEEGSYTRELEKDYEIIIFPRNN